MSIVRHDACSKGAFHLAEAIMNFIRSSHEDEEALKTHYLVWECLAKSRLINFLHSDTQQVV